MKKDEWKEEEISEDYCFACKDGGHIRACDFKKCLKSYHPSCVGKDDSFLEEEDRWTCGLHTCSCGESSYYQCFCCPTSYCQSCFRSAEYVKVERNKGFCVNCLRLVKMIEENKHVDSDGDEVDFDNTETVEFLFKDYWAIVKDQEGLTTEKVLAADVLLKRGRNFHKESDSDKAIDEESMSEPDNLEDDRDGVSHFKGSRRKRGRKKTQIKKSKKEKVFVGWATEELINFLKSIGKNTTERLNQLDVTEIIKEYVQSNNLFQPNKRRRNLVIPDEKLRILFRKKKLKYHKIYDMVKIHLAEEQSSDDFLLSSDENDAKIIVKKQQKVVSAYKSVNSEANHWKRKSLEPSKSSYAAIVADNIKRVYIKRSLVLDLLKNPETFDEKIVGCFVRVKNDPKDFYYVTNKAYQLGQVIGVKKAGEGEAYKVGEALTDVVLCISNIPKDIKISLLSDDDLEEMECEDLKQLVKKGLFKQPTTEELGRKIRSVHEDIVNHSIDREIVKLQKQIDRANEKGWRRELHEYIDKKVLLSKPETHKRLVEEIPEVIPDIDYTEVNMDGPINVPGGLGDEPKGPPDHCRSTLDQSAANAEGPAEEPKGKSDSSAEGPMDELKGLSSHSSPFGQSAAIVEVPAEEPEGESLYNAAAPANELKGAEVPANEQKDSEPERSSTYRAIEIKDEEKNPKDVKTAEIPIINLEDIEEEADVSEKAHQASANKTLDVHERIWCYIDPAGNEQGPVPLYALNFWKTSGYFEDNFRVWRSGQCQRDGVLLTTLLASAFSNSRRGSWSYSSG